MRNPLPKALCALLLAVLALSIRQPALADELEQAFTHPPDTARPMVYWFWMGRHITAEGITGDLEALKDAGFGGGTMCNMADCCTPWPHEMGNSLNPGMAPYMTEDWWKLVRHAAAESRRLGLDFGMHNCPGYESSGGPWITPELSMQELCYSQTPVDGGQKVGIPLPRPAVDPRAHMPFPVYNADTGRVEKPEIPARKTYYRDIAVLALPASGVADRQQVIDLTAKMTDAGALEWDAPPGKWIVYRFGHTTMGALIQPTIWKSTGLECDKMNPVAVAYHMDHVIADIKKHLGDLAGNGLNYLWFDSYEAGTPTWTPNMPQEFKTRRGYELTAFLPTFAKRTVASEQETAKFRQDFHRTICDLYRDVNFTISAQKAHAAGMQLQSEPYGGPWVVSEVVPIFDKVASEFWNRDGKYGPYAVGEVSAGCRLAGRNVVTAEAFTAGPGVSLWDETPAAIKSIGDAAYCDGVNRFMLHRFTHQPWNDRFKPGFVMGQWGTHFDRTQTWWEPGKAWVQYMQRCQGLLQWGKIASESGDVSAKSRGGAKVRSIHRSDGTAHAFFVANVARSAGAADVSFAVAGKQPELWDPVTGTMRNLPDFRAADGRTIIPLRFDNSQSYFIVFRKPASGGTAAVAAKNFPRLSLGIDLAGPWSVTFDPKWGGPKEPVTFASLTDWTANADSAIKYFSGTAVYRKSFDCNTENIGASMRLDLGAVNHMARVKLNGAELGVVWCAPWSVEIPAKLLKSAGNELEIHVTNVWANRLIGDEQQPADCEWLPGHMGHGGYLKALPDWVVNNQPRPSKGRYCFTTWNYFTKDSPLRPSGLLGPVRLMRQDWTCEPEDNFPPPAIEPGKVISPKNAAVTVTAWQSNESCAAYEADVLKTGLVPIASASDEHFAHDGGGPSLDPLHNGTTLNGAGDAETINDGKTFRGYDKRGALTFKFDLQKSPAGYDITEIRAFAGHPGGRASQCYSVSIALASAPGRFVKLADVAFKTRLDSTQIRLNDKKGGMLSSGVAAVRFDFHDGPLGFNVYREFQFAGRPAAQP